MFKYFLVVFTFIFGALAAMYYWIGVPEVYREAFPPERVPHYYGDPNLSLERIKIAAFYFVPKNKVTASLANWREVLERNLEKLQEFHTHQLQKRSSLDYEIYSDPVVGREENLAYDTEVTQHGNPEALRRIAAELEERVFSPKGDLFLPDFAREKSGVYRVLVIMYEGVGASGSENVALVSRIFLADPRYEIVAASILTHEFYHTLGVPDEYELETAIPTSQNIMGLGRTRPIEKTFLGLRVLKQFGLYSGR